MKHEANTLEAFSVPITPAFIKWANNMCHYADNNEAKAKHSYAKARKKRKAKKKGKK